MRRRVCLFPAPPLIVVLPASACAHLCVEVEDRSSRPLRVGPKTCPARDPASLSGDQRISVRFLHVGFTCRSRPCSRRSCTDRRHRSGMAEVEHLPDHGYQTILDATRLAGKAPRPSRMKVDPQTKARCTRRIDGLDKRCLARFVSRRTSHPGRAWCTPDPTQPGAAARIKSIDASVRGRFAACCRRTVADIATMPTHSRVGIRDQPVLAIDRSDHVAIGSPPL